MMPRTYPRLEPVAGPSGTPPAESVPVGAVGAAEAARLLGISLRTCRSMIASGELRSSKVRGRRVIARRYVEEFLQAQKRPRRKRA
jgi:excisionase family DNA binding protein